MKRRILIAIFCMSLLPFISGCDDKKKKAEGEELQSEEVVKEEAPATEEVAINTLTQAEKEDGWVLLFDGKTSEGWRGYKKDHFPSGWKIIDGSIMCAGSGRGEAGSKEGGDIIYDKKFKNFTLSLEWKISEGGNSGIFYHVQEGEQYKAPYETAPEYQLIDDIGFPEPLEDWQKLAADYAMYPADSTQKIVKKAGKWNTSRIVFSSDKAEYWLNVNKVVEFVPYSDDWEKRRTSGKWDAYPDYGTFKKGLIGLQDHGSFIWFKNIKIKEL